MSPPKKARVQPAKGSPPKRQNTTGRIVNKTQPQTEKQAPSNLAADNYVDEFHDYLDSIKTPEQVKHQWGEVQKAKAAAEAAGDRPGAMAAQRALDGLQQKANTMRMSVNDLPTVGQKASVSIRQAGAAASREEPLARVTSAFSSNFAAKKEAEDLAQAKAAAAKSKGGGYTPGKGRNANGKCGEWLARRELEDQGYEVIDVQNKSGHGIDVVGRDPKTGNVRVLEVKTTQTDVAPPLTGAGKKWGGAKFTDERRRQALAAKGHWQNQPEVLANAKKLSDWLKDAQRRKSKVDYEKFDVFVDDPNKGCIKRKDSKSSPWEAPTSKSDDKASPKPRRRK